MIREISMIILAPPKKRKQKPKFVFEHLASCHRTYKMTPYSIRSTFAARNKKFLQRNELNLILFYSFFEYLSSAMALQNERA